MKRYRLGELVEVTRGMSLPGANYATSGSLVRLTLGNFDYASGGFKTNTSKDNIYYTGKVKPEFILDKGDIITPLTEQTAGLLGSTARIPESGKYILSQDVALVTCKEGRIDPSFCYYLLSSASVRKQLSATAQQTKIRHTSPDRIKDVIVDIPSLSDQKAIGRFLDAIDKRIANARKINDYLEAMANQLYNYWFVQFDFPDESGLPYKSSGGKMVWNETLKREIPDGWEVVNIFEGASVLYGFPFSTESFVEETTERPIVRIRDILDGSVSAYTTEDVDEKYRLNKGDVVIGMDGNFHMNIWQDDNAYLNQRCVRIRPMSDSLVSSIQIFYDAKPYIEARERTIKGSTVGHLSDKDMKLLLILVPKRTKQFNPRPVFDNIVDEISRNRIEISGLIKQRNELLPLLMNGQVSVRQLNNHLSVR